MEKHNEVIYHTHHHHHDSLPNNKKNLVIVIMFNLIITLTEIIGGIFSGSLSLISDALHNLSDTGTLILSYISIKISEKPKNKINTYGYKRANILSAFINAVSLICISIFLIIEALKKLTKLQHINGNVVIIVAIIGLLGNLFSTIMLKKGSKDSINIKSSYLHMLGDTLSSAVVIVAGIIIKYLSIYWIDPILTVLISILIIKSGFDILKESISILMQETPVNIDIDKVKAELLKIDEIKDVHHIHIWKLDENNIILEGHIQIQDMLISESEIIKNSIENILKEHFNISHSVIQFEDIKCDNSICKI